MATQTSPDGFAFRINKVIHASVGDAAYPLDMRDVIAEFAPAYAPGVTVSVSSRRMDAVDGALIASTDRKNFSILTNSDVASTGRKNFTIAHEFGHFLCHRNLGREFWCSRDVLNGLSVDEVEAQANRFASQILLPNHFVRAVADGSEFSLDAVRDLARRTGSSVTAAALACVNLSSKPIGFAVMRDGFVRWGRASEKAYSMGLYFKAGSSPPAGSAADFESFPTDQIFDSGAKIAGWSADSDWRESGFYSARYEEAYFAFRQ